MWAPHADQVEIDWLAAELPRVATRPERAMMLAVGGGWWRWHLPAETRGDGAWGTRGIDYAFVLDGAEPALPDPRSAWQPHGVHGPSRTVDPASFVWSDDGWPGPRGGAGLLGGVLYELHVGTFTPEGTFDAAVGRLDHLVALGVDVVELLPVAAFPTDRGWGYDGVGLWAVQDSYGGPDALARFVDACHARGIGVALDVVLNHLGASGNYLARFGPYFTDAHETPWGPAVNLDQPGSPEVRAFLVGSVLRWFRDFHVDALRLDAVHALRDGGPRHLLAELSDAVAALAAELGRPLDLVAESDLNDVAMVAPTASDGRGMTAQWDDDLHHALHVALTGEAGGYYADFAGGNETFPVGGALAVLAHVLTHGFLHDGRMSSFRGKAWGRPVDVEAFDARRLLGYLQTHDQVGNRAAGERISALCTPGRHAAGAALYLLAPTTAMVFMGEEWAAATPWQFFTSFTEPDLESAVREGRRAEFGAHGWAGVEVPDPQDPATRDRSVLCWPERAGAEHARMLRWYTALTGIRRAWPATDLTRFADVSCAFDEDAGWFAMTHAPGGREPVTVVVNLGDAEARVPVPGAAGIRLAWDAGQTRQDSDAVVIPPDSVAVVGR
ncbi:MAG: malto-oligosyltrehalose trehalohydrolase [Dermatophilaceae bacterium]